MVYKVYRKRGNKLCGPYYYESYRDEKGIARKRYIGTELPGHSKINYFLVSALIFIILIGIFIGFMQFKPEMINKELKELWFK